MQQHPLLQTLFNKALFPVPSPTSLLHPSNKLHPEARNASPEISNSTTPQAHCQTCGSAKQEMSQRSSATSATTSPDPIIKHNPSLQPLSIITTPRSRHLPELHNSSRHRLMAAPTYRAERNPLGKGGWFSAGRFFSITVRGSNVPDRFEWKRSQRKDLSVYAAEVMAKSWFGSSQERQWLRGRCLL